MNEVGLEKLLKEQQLGLDRTDQDLHRLSTFKADYTAVIERLQNLAKCFTQPAILPLSKKALVPGRLIHTNEVLVHLGGSNEYFAEMSTHEAVQLLERRIERLDEQNESLVKQKQLIKDRLIYASEFAKSKQLSSSSVAETKPGAFTAEEKEVEIREEFNSDTERQWLEKHKEYRRRERHALTSVQSPKISKPRVRFSDAKPESSDSSTDSSDYPDDTLINFRHSNVPSPLPRCEVTDFSTLTMAEAVDMCLKHGRIPLTIDTVPEPFGVIAERTPVTSENAPTPPDEQAPPRTVSRFRAQRSRFHETAS